MSIGLIQSEGGGTLQSEGGGAILQEGVIVTATGVINPDLSIREQVEVVIGSVADWPLTCTDTTGTPIAFAFGDTIAAKVYSGQDQATLFSPPAGWTGGTGYATGAVTVSPTSAQTAALEWGGDYILQLWWTSADGSRTACVKRAQLLALAGPGTGTQAVAPYCSLKDLLIVAPWVANLQRTDTDQEGFYSQRLQAREWLDDIIVASWRGNVWAFFGDASQPAANWSGWGAQWRTPLPSKWLMDQLAANHLIVRPKVIRICAYKAASIVGLSQIASKNNYAGAAMYCADKASEELQRLNCELDVNGDGLADMVIPLGEVNVLYT